MSKILKAMKTFHGIHFCSNNLVKQPFLDCREWGRAMAIILDGAIAFADMLRPHLAFGLNSECDVGHQQ